MKSEDIVKAARDSLAEAKDADMLNIERGVDDLKYLVGDHWPEAERREREIEGRPCITVNSLPQYVRGVNAQIRSLNPAIKVKPADSAADPDVAEIMEGMIRHIEYQCDASSVYEAAGESAAACSIGHWRIRTDYCGNDTFDQEILIERIHNAFSVFTDPMAKDPTRKDARYRLIIEEIAKDDFVKKYPKADTSGFTADHKPAEFENWGGTDTVVVAEYYWTECEEYTIGEMPDGSIIKDPRPPEAPVRTRRVQAKRIKWAKVTGKEVLEGPLDIPGEWIPIVTVTGEEWHLGEETYRSSVIRFAKDSAVLYNVARSAQAEVMMLQPKAPYLITANQVAGLETYWAEAHKGNRPYLPYNADPDAPMPSRVPPPIASSGLMQEMQLAAEDMKRTTGIYDASLGARSNETSGVAIDARKQESQSANSVYADNLVKAVAHTGRIIVEMIPKVYDTERIVRVLGPDGQEKMELINSLVMSQNGPVPVNDMTIGKYDTIVSVGPSYNTKRESSQDAMMEFLRVVPAAQAVTADLVAKAQDWPDAERFADRLRKTLPPGIAEDNEGEGENPEAMAQAQQAQQMQAQQEQQAMQMQQQAAEMAMAEQAAKVRVAEAQAQEAEAKAQRAEFEAQKAQFEARGTQVTTDADEVQKRMQLAAMVQPAY